MTASAKVPITGRLRASAAGPVLAVVAGLATAGFAAYCLEAAWADYSRCNPPASGVRCTFHPFWGFSPALFLAGAILGIVVGLVLVLLGLLTHRGVLGPRGAAAGLLAGSLLGLIAYGGLGVGVVAGVAAALIVRPSRAPPAPAEWPGMFPAGTPPAPRNPKRVLPSRAPVAEWDGIIAASVGPPGGLGGTRPALPTADRLAAALEKSRLASPRSPEGSELSPIVVLPPPPVGLRSTARAPYLSPAVSSPEAPGAREASPAASSSVAIPPASTVPAYGPAASPPSSLRAFLERTASFPPSAPPADGSEAAPEADRTAMSRAARGPLRTGAYRSSSPPTPVAGPRGGPRPEPGSASSPAPSRAAPPRAAPASDRPPPPKGPLPRTRSRAWRCDACGRVNAPWSARCGHCQTAAPE